MLAIGGATAGGVQRGCPGSSEQDPAALSDRSGGRCFDGGAGLPKPAHGISRSPVRGPAVLPASCLGPAQLRQQAQAAGCGAYCQEGITSVILIAPDVLEELVEELETLSTVKIAFLPEVLVVAGMKSPVGCLSRIVPFHTA